MTHYSIGLPIRRAGLSEAYEFAVLHADAAAAAAAAAAGSYRPRFRVKHQKLGRPNQLRLWRLHGSSPKQVTPR